MRYTMLLPVAVLACGKPAVTLVPVPDETGRIEVLTSVAGWEARLADLTACVLRVTRPGDCAGNSSPPVCDTRSKEEVLRPLQPILDSLPKVRLNSSFSMGRDLRVLFPSATASSDVLDARRRTACADWSGGACYAIRTDKVAFVFSGASGALPERILIVQVAPACGQSRPDREGGP